MMPVRREHMTHARTLAFAGVLSVLLGVLGTTRSASAGERFEIDPVHSHVGFHIRHFGAGFVYGRFNRFGGEIVHGERDAAGGRVTLEIETQSIDTKVKKRDAHLRGPDFFNAKQFPTIRFRSERIERKDARHFVVYGQLELHGVRKPVSAEVEYLGRGKDPEGNERIGYRSTLTIRRSDFGMNYMLGPIGDEVHIVIAIEAIKRSS